MYAINQAANYQGHSAKRLGWSYCKAEAARGACPPAAQVAAAPQTHLPAYKSHQAGSHLMAPAQRRPWSSGTCSLSGGVVGGQTPCDDVYTCC